MKNGLLKNNFIFIDESGKPEVFSSKSENLVLSGKASKYLVLAAVRCTDQLLLQQQLTELRLALLKDENLKGSFSSAYSLDSFHAQVDYDIVKTRVFEFINKLDIKIDVIVVEKLKCLPVLQQNPGKLYGVMAGQLIKDICHLADNTEIIFSRKDSKLQLRKELEIEVERVRLQYMQKHPNLSNKVLLTYFHNPHYTHGGLQMADYIAYAIYQVYERNNRIWYELIRDKIGRIHDICNKKYFTRSNPL